MVHGRQASFSCAFKLCRATTTTTTHTTNFSCSGDCTWPCVCPRPFRRITSPFVSRLGHKMPPSVTINCSLIVPSISGETLGLLCPCPCVARPNTGDHDGHQVPAGLYTRSRRHNHGLAARVSGCLCPVCPRRAAPCLRFTAAMQYVASDVDGSIIVQQLPCLAN